MNDLTQPFMTRTGQINAFVMRRNGHLYEAFIDSGFNQSNNVATLGEDERQFTSEITIKVLGYLIGDGISDDRPIVRKDENFVELPSPEKQWSQQVMTSFSLTKDILMSFRETSNYLNYDC